MAYDPSVKNDRKYLASKIRDTLFNNGFDANSLHEEFNSKECIYGKLVKDHIVICVFSTIEYGECRPKGDDAIRVVGFYVTREGDLRALAKSEKRIFRTGSIRSICDRLCERVEEVERNVNNPMKCRCGAPMFTSKKGNTVCTELCWKKGGYNK